MFGLYAPADLAGGLFDVPLPEALAVYGELSHTGLNPDSTVVPNGPTYRDFAFAYEFDYQSNIANAAGDLTSSQLANTDVGALAPLGDTVGTLEQELQPAATTLLQHYITNGDLNPFATIYAGTAIDSLDVQVGLPGDGSDLVASQRTGYMLNEGDFYPNSLLIGDGGNDTLDGSGSGDDALIGDVPAYPGVEEADYTFIVGSGNDYIVAGPGSALIDGGAAGVAMGSGNDTVVLGDPTLAHSTGIDTVWAGGSDTLYVGAGDSDVIHLTPLSQVAIEVVSQTGSVSPLSIDATALVGGSPGTYLDFKDNVLVQQTQNADGTSSVELFGLGGPSSAPQAMAKGPAPESVSPAATGTGSLSGGFLELDGFQGTSDAGVTLNAGSATTPGASNLGDFTETTYSTYNSYQDHSGAASADSMIGANTTGGNYNVLEGEGIAGYIYAGDGNNEAFADDAGNSPVGSVFTQPLSTVIQGGTGDQLLVGMGIGDGVGDGQETLIGGAMGSDTTASTTIDGGGANVDALLSGGSQNSLILGGLGTDTVVAGSAVAGSGKPDPMTIALAGLSFWAYYQQEAQGGGTEVMTGEPEVSVPASTDPGQFQIDVALDELDVNEPVVPPDELGTSYGPTFGLLGSEWDTGTDTSPWKDANGNPVTLPGSLLIGGSGLDYLIGNSGNDTLIGGTPANPQAGVVDEVLVGAGGANLIYGGGGTEWIFADLSPGADTDWANLDPADADTIYGGSGNEYIYGSGGNDVIYGGSGNYTINTGDGNAYVETGSGNSIVNGGTGNDTIIAGSGADSITTGNGNDSVDGGDGQSTISIGTGNDTLTAGDGATSWNAGTGAEAFEVGMSAGNQTISGSTSASSIDVNYVDGITSGDVVARWDSSNDLTLTNEATGSQVEIPGYFNGQSNVSVTFSDDVTWGTAQLVQESMTPDTGNDLLTGWNGNDTITGGPGEDTIVGVKGDNVLTGGTGDSTIYGGSGSDTIEGGSGSNALYGGTGTETFLFNIGDGPATITGNSGSASNYTLSFGAGIAPSDVTYTMGPNDNLLIAFGTVSSSTIDIPNFFPGSQIYGGLIGSVQFDGGPTYTQSQLLPLISNAIIGTSGNDLLTGNSNPSIFESSSGSDTDVGGSSGNDTFVFDSSNEGTLEIDDTYGASQQPVLLTNDPDFNNWTWSGYGTPVIPMWTDGQNLYLCGGAVTLKDMWSSSSSGVADVQLFEGNNVTTFTRAQLMQIVMNAPMFIGQMGGKVGETVYGTSGADSINIDGGASSIYGGGGSDTIFFQYAEGPLTISEPYTSGQQPILEVLSGISESHLQVERSGSGVLLLFNDGGRAFDGYGGPWYDQVTLDGMWSTPGSDGVAEVQFADGTTYTSAQLVAMAAASQDITGTSGNDTLVGTPGDELFDGKEGDDSEVGNGGNDTFVFDPGYGQLTINSTYSAEDQSVLELGKGIAASSLKFSVSGDDIVVTDGIAGDQITLQGEDTGSGVALVQLADGTTYTAAELMQMAPNVIDGTSGNDTLTGRIGVPNFIDGKGGDDVEYGGGGDDTFVFDAGYGKLEISEQYTSGRDPALQLGPGITEAALHVTSDGLNVMVTDGIAGDEITLDSMWADADNGVALVQFSDGTTLTAAQLMQMELTGTPGNDTIMVIPGNYLVDGKGGSDLEDGVDAGNDTFVFNPGYGHLEINVEYASGEKPVLQLGTGISPAYVGVTSNGYNLRLTDGVTGDQITLDNEAHYSSSAGVAIVQFADGSTLTAAQLIQLSKEITGTPGNETLHGTTGADFMDGRGGDDSVIGDGGSDTFVFNSGYGQLTINEAFKSGQHPVLQFGPGITAATLHVAKSGNNMVLTDGVAGDQITLINMWTTSTDGITSAQFSDGSSLTRAQLFQMAMIGTPGNDTLYGTSGADSIDGKGGTDSVVGEGGSDTFVFDSGYGSLTINEVYTSSQKPVLEFGTGIASSALHATKSGNNLVLTDGVSGDQITLINMWSTSTDGVASAKFADGSSLTRAQLIALEMIGTPGNDTIYGTSGADLIDGKGGDDSVIGEGGNDTFVFDSGYGKLTVNETFTSSQSPILKMGPGITKTTLQVKASGSNLLLSDGVTGDQVTLLKMATSATNGVALVKLSDGTTLTRAQLIAMEPAAAPAVATSSATLDVESAGHSTSTAGVATGSHAVGTFTVSPGHSEANTNDASGVQPISRELAADAQPAPSPVAAASSQPEPAADTQARANTLAIQPAAALPSTSVLNTTLGSFSSLVPIQPESDATPPPGAPADPSASDIDDPDFGATYALAATAGQAPPQSLAGMPPANLPALAFGQRQWVNTANAADAMVRTLTQRNNLRSSLVGDAFTLDARDAIRLQGDENWSRSWVDRSLAALPAMGSGIDDLSSRVTDLAHAQLVSAMASFSPSNSAASVPMAPANLDTYTIAAAIGMH